MNLLATAPAWLVAILLFLLLLAAIEDGWRLQISDWTSGAIALAAFLAIGLNGPIVGLWQNFLLFVVVLVIGTAMFARGWMGGGDIKLLAASVLWFDLSSGFIYRPLLNNNVQIRGGAAVLLPDDGVKNLFGDETLYSVFGNLILQY